MRRIQKRESNGFHRDKGIKGISQTMIQQISNCVMNSVPETEIVRNCSEQ